MVVEIWGGDFVTPWRIHMEPKNGGLVDDVSFLNLLILGSMFIFRDEYPP